MSNHNGGPSLPTPSQPYSTGPPPPPSGFPTTPTGTSSHHLRPGPLGSDQGTMNGSNNAAHPDVLELLGTVPFIQYTPSSRVARHLQTLNLTQSTGNVSDPGLIYPQYAGVFDQMDRAIGSSGSTSYRHPGQEQGPDRTQYPQQQGQAQSQVQMQVQAQPRPYHLPQPRSQAQPQPQPQAYPNPPHPQTFTPYQTPTQTPAQVWEQNKQAALSHLDRWGGHVGQQSSQGGVRLGGGQHQHQPQFGYGGGSGGGMGGVSVHGNGNGNGNGYVPSGAQGGYTNMNTNGGGYAQGQGLGAGSWIGGVRQTIDLTGNGSSGRHATGAGPTTNPFTEFQHRVIPPYQPPVQLQGSSSNGMGMTMSTGFGLLSSPSVDFHSPVGQPQFQPRNQAPAHAQVQGLGQGYPTQQQQPQARQVSSGSVSATRPTALASGSKQGVFAPEQSRPFLDDYLADFQARERAEKEQERARREVQERYEKERLDKEKVRISTPVPSSTMNGNGTGKGKGNGSVSVSPQKRRMGEDHGKAQLQVKASSSSSTSTKGKQAGGTKLVPFVEIPVRRPVKLGGFRSPDESEEEEDDDDDEDADDFNDGDYGGDYDMDRSTRRRRLSDSGMAMMTPGNTGTPSGRRTGFTSAAKSVKKDHHKVLYRLVEDVFEAEDAFPADLAEEDLKGSTWFDRLTSKARQDDKALLSRITVERLSGLFKQCTRSARDRKKRGLTRSAVGGDGDVPENLSKWETDELSRVVGLLQRSMTEAEGVVIFPNDGHSSRGGRAAEDEAGQEKGKPVKKKRKPVKAEDDGSVGVLEEPKARAAMNSISMLVDAVMAAECVLTLLTADDLAKPLYSEDIIRETLDCASVAIGDVIMPFLDALSGTTNIQSSVLAHVVAQSDDRARQIRQVLSMLAKSTTRFLHRLTRLIAHEGLSLPESLVYRTTQLVIQLVFVVDPIVESKTGATARSTVIWKEAMDGQSGTKALKAEAMDVLKTLYIVQGNAEREEMLREVLGFTAKVAEQKKSQNGYRTRKGTSIHFVSALLLELMQNCAHGVREMLDTADVMDGMGMDDDETEARPAAKLNTSLLSAYMDEMNRSAQFILQYMLNKLSNPNAGKQKSQLEVNYKAILETFLQDQVEVLYMPEFPAAAISLGITARTLISVLEDSKPTPENASIRGIAIDHLGVLVSALRQFEITYAGGEAPMALTKIVQKGQQSAWASLKDANHVMLQTLQKNASQNGLYSSAADVMTAKWLLDLHKALRQESPEAGVENGSDTEMEQDLSPLMRELQADLIRTSRKVEDENVFAHAKDDLLAQADRPCILVEMARPLQAALGLIFKAILGCMSAPIVAHRTKAIKALGAAIAVDAAYLSRPDIRKGIQDRISDSSPAVRDAAIDLVGKYIPDTPDLAVQYYPSISARIADTGPAVRKRVIKLFRVIYDLVSKRNIRTEICCKLVGLVDDEEDSVKDLALATLREIWFPQDTVPGSRQTRRSETPASTTSSRDAGEASVHPLVDVVARYTNDMVPVELTIREISKSDTKTLDQEYSRLIGAMLDRLMSNDSLTPAETLPLVRSIHLLSSAKPQSMDLQRATSLLPYLGQATTPDEVLLRETLMRIFRLSIPYLPKTASNFAIELSQILLPMIAKPSGKLSTLEEAVMCYSVTVTYLTQEYIRIIKILTSCVRKMRDETAKAKKSKANKPLDQKTLPFIASIATLLVAKSDLDTVRSERPEVDDFIYELTDGSISTFMFETLLDLWDLELDQTLRHAIIQCFGHLYQSFPTLMTDKRSIKVMDSVLTGESTNQQTTMKMLTLIYETLVTLVDSNPNVSDGKGKASIPAPVDMDQLIGDTAGFAESGVGSAIVQRYIDKVLHAALSRYDDIQKVAIDILSLTIQQGLAHPIQSFPIIVTLETSDYMHVSEKAFALHTHLQAKHASIINSRYFESAKVVFDHRKTIDDSAVGYRNPGAPIALMDRWYSLIRDKRAIRQDFLKAMCKAFSFDATPRDVTWDDVLLARFMAENLALLEYKVQEEVLQIITAMTALLAGLGMQVVEIVNSVKIVGQPTERLGKAKLVRDDENHDDMEQDDSQMSKIDYDIESLINATAMVGIIVLLKTRLKKTYNLTEDKVTKFNPGKKTAASDRAAVKRITDGSGGLPDWLSLPGVGTRVHTVAEYQDQAIAFTKLIEEDGIMKPEYSGEEDDEED